MKLKSVIVYLVAFLLSGCAQSFTAKTKASYTPGGAITYESDKEQVGLDVVYEVDENGKVKTIRIKVDKSGTPEAVTAAALAAQLKALTILESAMKGAGKVP